MSTVPKHYGKNNVFSKILKLRKAYRWLKYYLSGNNNYRIAYLRDKGVKIGDNCLINYVKIISEPYLVEIGDEVAIAPNSTFMTHDGSTWLFKDKSKDIRSYGKISIGNNCFIASSCIILPNTKIGSNCIIGAGSVVRGVIPDDSVVFGNPAKVVMKTSMAKKFIMKDKFSLDSAIYSDSERRIAVENLFK